jgi:hypothetical protein
VAAALEKLQKSISAGQANADAWHKVGLDAAKGLQTRRPWASKSVLASYVRRHVTPVHKVGESAALKQVNRWIAGGDLKHPAKKPVSNR